MNVKCRIYFARRKWSGCHTYIQQQHFIKDIRIPWLLCIKTNEHFSIIYKLNEQKKERDGQNGPLRFVTSIFHQLSIFLDRDNNGLNADKNTVLNNASEDFVRISE